jgi:hypothetical protein
MAAATSTVRVIRLIICPMGHTNFRPAGVQDQRLNVVPVELALTKPLQKRRKGRRYEGGPVKTLFSSTKQSGLPKGSRM